jgi:hypothetical protein
MFKFELPNGAQGILFCLPPQSLKHFCVCKIVHNMKERKSYLLIVKIKSDEIAHSRASVGAKKSTISFYS